jgi:glycosyltransferase involved in cell wall biosynthesis
MKILLGVLYYEPAWAYGGPPRMVYTLARELVRRGHEVTVLTTDALDRGKRIGTLEEVSDGVHVRRFRNLSNWLAFHVKILLPVGMRRWIESNVGRFDMVHLFETRTMLNAWASQAAHARGVPFVLSVWGSLPSGEGWKALLKKRFDRRHGAVYLGKAASLLAQNDHEAQLYADYGGDPARVVLWPLGVEEITELPARGAFKKQLGLTDEKLLLFVGRIHELKGLEPLLRAFAAAGDGAHLAVIGHDDGDLARIQSLARELGVASRVHFPGPRHGADALSAYVDCDLFCITPTHFEETSLAALTACAVGRPVLINDRCGIPWLDEYRAGVCVPHSIENLTRALAELLGDPARLAEMGASARRMMEERFFLPRIVDQLEEIYRQAAQRKLAA